MALCPGLKEKNIMNTHGNPKQHCIYPKSPVCSALICRKENVQAREKKKKQAKHHRNSLRAFEQ